MTSFQDILEFLFGLQQSISQLTLVHLCMRGFLVYFAGIFLARLHSQFITITTPFNYMINFIIGSLLANAIVGEGPYFKIIAMCFLIFMINFIIEMLCYWSIFFEDLFKGEPDILVKNGRVIWKNMRKNLITHDELMQAVRSKTKENNLTSVKKAFYENNGEITIIEK